MAENVMIFVCRGKTDKDLETQVDDAVAEIKEMGYKEKKRHEYKAGRATPLYWNAKTSTWESLAGEEYDPIVKQLTTVIVAERITTPS